jgi:hypothetical protein
MNKPLPTVLSAPSKNGAPESTGAYWHKHGRNVITLRLGTDPTGRVHALEHEMAHWEMGHGWHDDEWESVAVRRFKAVGLDPQWVVNREEMYGHPIRQWLEEN